jgi:hypothetical protein
MISMPVSLDCTPAGSTAHSEVQMDEPHHLSLTGRGCVHNVMSICIELNIRHCNALVFPLSAEDTADAFVRFACTPSHTAFNRQEITGHHLSVLSTLFEFSLAQP